MQSTQIAVLVVEDEPLIRLAIIDELEAGGFTIYEARNAAEAVVILESNPAIHLMFSDIDMPGDMDGLKLAVLVRDRWPRLFETAGRRSESS